MRSARAEGIEGQRVLIDRGVPDTREKIEHIVIAPAAARGRTAISSVRVPAKMACQSVQFIDDYRE